MKSKKQTCNQKTGYCSAAFLPIPISHTDAPNITYLCSSQPHLLLPQELKVSYQFEKDTTRCNAPQHTACAKLCLSKLKNQYLVAQNIIERPASSPPARSLTLRAAGRAARRAHWHREGPAAVEFHTPE